MHESVLLILKNAPTDEIIEAAIAPWSDDATYGIDKPANGNESHWDYWRIGGRWPKKLLVKAGVAAVTGPKAWEFAFEREHNNKTDADFGIWPDGVDAARFCDVDWHEMARRNDPQPPLTCYSVCDGRVWESKGYRVPDGVYEDGDPKYDYRERTEPEWQALLQSVINRAEPSDWVVMLDCHD